MNYFCLHVYIMCDVFLESVTHNYSSPRLEITVSGVDLLLTPKPQLTCAPPAPSSLPPQLQRPHRLRCFTQPMKCLKDTESVSPHGHGVLSAGLPGGTGLSLSVSLPVSLSVSCMHSSSSAWIYWWPVSAHVQSTKQHLQRLSTNQRLCAGLYSPAIVFFRIES